MTVWALVSDVHGRGDRLARALADARTRAAGRILALGDIGSTSALDLLDSAGAECVFGNWEASGLRGLPPPYRAWVAHWPAQFRTPAFLAAHASPVWPAGLAITGAIEHLRSHGQHWSALFPSLQRSDDARKAAFHELELAGVAVFFHGHTHVQEAWRQRVGAAPERLDAAQQSFSLQDGERWLIGVGSVGDPHDGAGACYTTYDDETRQVSWRRA